MFDQDLHFLNGYDKYKWGAAVPQKQCLSKTLNYARELKTKYLFLQGYEFTHTRRIPEDLTKKKKKSIINLCRQNQLQKT